MKTNTAKNLIAVIVIAGLLMGSPVGAQGTTVNIIPGTTSVVQEQTVTVTIQVENVSNLFGAEIHMTFDPTLLEVIDADGGTAGVQIGHGGFLSPDFIAQNQVDANAGTIDYAISQMPNHDPANGSGSLATITFRGKAPGTSALTFNTVLLADTNGGGIATGTVNGTIQVIPSDATPTFTPTPTPTQPAPPTATYTPTPTPTATPVGPTPTPTATPLTPVPTATWTPTPYPYITPTPTYTPVPGQIQGYHVVRYGETLYAIGRAYATRPLAIATQNHILNPNQLYVGVRLAIPVAPWVPVPPGPTAQRQFTPGGGTPPPPPPCRYMHTVRYGETLSGIGFYYGVSIWAIARSNNIHNLHLIYSGQVLCIP